MICPTPFERRGCRINYIDLCWLQSSRLFEIGIGRNKEDGEFGWLKGYKVDGHGHTRAAGRVNLNFELCGCQIHDGVPYSLVTM